MSKEPRPRKVSAPPKEPKKLDAFERHTLAIARQSLRMPDAILGVMGGTDKTQATETVRKLTGHDASSNASSNASSTSWPISGRSLSAAELHDDEGHRRAMKALGWEPIADVVVDGRGRRGRPKKRLVPTKVGELRGNVGQRVLISFSNGYEAWGTIVKIYKNGARSVRFDDDSGTGTANRHPSTLWVRP